MSRTEELIWKLAKPSKKPKRLIIVNEAFKNFMTVEYFISMMSKIRKGLRDKNREFIYKLLKKKNGKRISR